MHLDGSASSDPDSTAGTHDDIATFEWFENYGAGNQVLLGTGETLDLTLVLGSHLITLRVTDRGGLSDNDEVAADVVDTTPPQLSVVLNPGILFPPDNRYYAIHATVTALDQCGGTAVSLIGLISSDVGRSSAFGPASDVHGVNLGTADFDFDLRARKLRSGSGRIYTVSYQAADGSGNVAKTSATVTVSHDSQPPRSSQGSPKKPPRIH